MLISAKCWGRCGFSESTVEGEPLSKEENFPQDVALWAQHQWSSIARWANSEPRSHSSPYQVGWKEQVGEPLLLQAKGVAWPLHVTTNRNMGSCPGFLTMNCFYLQFIQQGPYSGKGYLEA